jgi:hypothetical protein
MDARYDPAVDSAEAAVDWTVWTIPPDHEEEVAVSVGAGAILSCVWTTLYSPLDIGL